MKIRIEDKLPPESNAMVQALYSRSPKSVEDHLRKVEEVGADEFMSTYYVGYGHASIGDCGTTTIYIEGVSLLAAKAIQHWPLYSGQEASTRYMDFSKGQIVDPLGTPESKAILDRWMAFYHYATEPTRSYLRQTHPITENDDPVVYERAIKARSFDILRGFLPAGTCTNLSWHTNLRQAQDHLDWLDVHPLKEVRVIAHCLRADLREKYPSSFREEDRYKEWRQEITDSEYYGDGVMPRGLVPTVGDPWPRRDERVRLSPGRRYIAGALANRPPGATIPPWMDLGTVESELRIDFGSFRDLQRHRNLTMAMPELAPEGFEPWYIQQLPMVLRAEAEHLAKELRLAIYALDAADSSDHQYYCAMGFTVPVLITQSVGAFLYRVERRSQPDVHPTLRRVAINEGRLFADECAKLGYDFVIHLNETPDTFNPHRGKQTIVEKETK